MKKYYVQLIYPNGESVDIEQKEELIPSIKHSLLQGEKKWLSSGDTFYNLDYVSSVRFYETEGMTQKEIEEWL